MDFVLRMMDLIGDIRAAAWRRRVPPLYDDARLRLGGTSGSGQRPDTKEAGLQCSLHARELDRAANGREESRCECESGHGCGRGRVPAGERAIIRGKGVISSQ